MPPVIFSHPSRLGLFSEHWRLPHQGHSTGRFPRYISVCIATAWEPLHADSGEEHGAGCASQVRPGFDLAMSCMSQQCHHGVAACWCVSPCAVCAQNLA